MTQSITTQPPNPHTSIKHQSHIYTIHRHQQNHPKNTKIHYPTAHHPTLKTHATKFTAHQRITKQHSRAHIPIKYPSERSYCTLANYKNYATVHAYYFHNSQINITARQRITKQHCRAHIPIKYPSERSYCTLANYKNYATVHAYYFHNSQINITARQRTKTNTLPCNNPIQK